MSKALTMAGVLIVLLVAAAHGAGPAGHKAFAPAPMMEHAYEMPIPAGTKLSPTTVNRIRAQLADFSFAVKADPPMPLTETPMIANIAMSALPAPVKP